jgi:hypothetical protein
MRRRVSNYGRLRAGQQTTAPVGTQPGRVWGDARPDHRTPGGPRFSQVDQSRPGVLRLASEGSPNGIWERPSKGWGRPGREPVGGSPGRLPTGLEDRHPEIDGRIFVIDDREPPEVVKRPVTGRAADSVMDVARSSAGRLAIGRRRLLRDRTAGRATTYAQLGATPVHRSPQSFLSVLVALARRQFLFVRGWLLRRSVYLRGPAQSRRAPNTDFFRRTP